jgi:hypothetical protein
MGKTKFDGVVEAAHYSPDGMIDWVRVYQRRGPTFSDRILLKRDQFIAELKLGMQYYSGKRIPLMAGTFELAEPVHLVQKDGKEVLLIGEEGGEKDNLKGVPII